jgi:hypothetical protein
MANHLPNDAISDDCDALHEEHHRVNNCLEISIEIPITESSKDNRSSRTSCPGYQIQNEIPIPKIGKSRRPGKAK